MLWCSVESAASVFEQMWMEFLSTYICAYFYNSKSLLPMLAQLTMSTASTVATAAVAVVSTASTDIGP